MNKNLGKIAIAASISIFICIGYRAAGYFAPDAHVIKLASYCTQAAFDITKTFAVSQLGKGHAQKLIKACKRASAIIAIVTINATTKFLNWDKAHDLGKYGLAIVHWLLPFDVNLNHRKAYQPS